MPGPPFCSDCRQWIPYSVLEAPFLSEDLDNTTFVAFDIHTAGNLRRIFPNSRVVASFFPFYTPPGGASDSSCYFVWSEDLAVPPPDAYLPREVKLSATKVTGKWPQAIDNFRDRQTSWNIVKLTPNPVLAKKICRLPIG